MRWINSKIAIDHNGPHRIDEEILRTLATHIGETRYCQFHQLSGPGARDGTQDDLTRVQISAAASFLNSSAFSVTMSRFSASACAKTT